MKGSPEGIYSGFISVGFEPLDLDESEERVSLEKRRGVERESGKLTLRL